MAESSRPNRYPQLSEDVLDKVAQLRVDDSESDPQSANILKALLVVYASTAATHEEGAAKSHIRRLNAPGIKILRRTCRALRDLHDQIAVRELHLGSFICPSESPFPSPEEIGATVGSLLARGSRPKSVSMFLPQPPSDPALMEQRALNLLAAVDRGVCVSELKLVGYTPLTLEAAKAITRLGPSLSFLRIWGPPFHVVPQGAADANAATLLLLQSVGLRLQELDLQAMGLWWPPDGPVPLSCCTALTRLALSCSLGLPPSGHLDGGLADESALLRALSGLTSLRDLSLTRGATPPADLSVRQARAASLESSLSPLTALTRLELRLNCLNHAPERYDEEGQDYSSSLYGRIGTLRGQGLVLEAAALESTLSAEWRAVAAAAARMPGLRALCTPAIACVTDLAPLMALTHLAVGALTLPPPPAPGVDAAAPAAGCYGLPPQLRQLFVHTTVPLAVAAALRRSLPMAAATAAPAPPAPMTLHTSCTTRYSAGNSTCWGLEFKPHRDGMPYVDEEGRMTAAAISDARAAGAALKTAFLPLPTVKPAPEHLQAQGVGPFDLEYLSAMQLALVCPTEEGGPMLPAAWDDGAPGGGASSGSVSHWGSWMGHLLARLPPIIYLRLEGFELFPRDLLGLGRSLDSVTTLTLLNCRYHVSALPLLGGLAALRHLSLCFDDWVAAADLAVAKVEAAFLALTAPLGGAAAAAAAAPDGGGGAGYDPQRTPLPLPQLQTLRIACGEEQDAD